MKRRMSIMLMVVLMFTTVLSNPIYSEKDGNVFDYKGDLIKLADNKVKLDEKDLGLLIKSIEAKDGRSIRLVLDEDLDYLVLTRSSIEALKESGLKLLLEKKEFSSYLDFKDVKKASGDGSIGLKKIDNEKAVDKVRDQDAMKRAMDFSFENLDGLRVNLGYGLDKFPREDKLERDLVALYDLSSGQKFLTGKLLDSRIAIDTSKEGQYALVETHYDFKDTRNKWYEKPVKSMFAKNVLDGVGGGRFNPEGKVTRAQFVKMLVASMEVELVAYDENFSDVKSGKWYSDYVATAVEKGLVEGFDGKFRPNDSINREEMAVIYARILGEKMSEDQIKKELSSFTDQDKISKWAKESVALVKRHKIMQGNSNGSFKPKSDATRAESAKTIYNMY